jgi:hemoglobin
MMMTTENAQLTEQHISKMVHRFYERAMADDGLRPIFEATIHDWDAHHRVVVDFWSRVLLNTDRYRGSPYPPHAGLPIRSEHFDRWLTLFREAAQEVLPADAAELAIARAEHMAEAFKAGMFHGFGTPLKPTLGHPVT